MAACFRARGNIVAGFSRVTLMASVSLLAVAAGVPAFAQQPAAARNAAPVTELDEVVVSADRVESTIFDSPSTVSVKTDKDIDRDNIHTPRELVRDEPGVSVGNQPLRGGATNYVIRGIGDNRVRLQIDGIKLPDFPSSNIGAGNYTRDFVDFDALKRVEIIRGPASALYGSDAIGGVVSFITKDPADYLAVVGKDWYTSFKAGFDSSDRSFSETTVMAGRAGAWEAMILYTRRDGHQLLPNTYRQSNPQTYWSNNILGKLVYNSPDFGQFKLTTEYLQRNYKTLVLTDMTTTVAGPTYTRVFSSLGDDTTKVPRVNFDWTVPVSSIFADTIKTSLYWTEVDRDEVTSQYRGVASRAAPASYNRYRLSDFGFKQTIRGAEIQVNAERDILGGRHSFVYGASYDFTSTSRPRDRTELNLLTGVSTKTFAGEVFPGKNFPDTDTTMAAVYIQDVAQYGRLRIIPAVRFDYYHLDPKPDQAFANSNTKNFTINKQTEYAISPKLGLTYDLTEQYRLFAQYSHGFRAPPYDNGNFAYSNPLQGYEILPNGNLKPETSDGFEAGLRGRFENGSSFQVNAFNNYYKNFLATKVIGISAGGLQQFQYQNLSNVRIWGFEAKGDWRINEEWSLYGAVAYARGEDEQTKRGLDTIDPLTGVVGMRYQNVAGWGGEVRLKHAMSQKHVSEPNVFVSPGYTTVDVLASYEIKPRLTVNAGIYNIFDKRYFNHQDVAGILTTNANLELFRAPGRTFAANATVRF